jgi:hypothetical protein
MQGDVVTVAAVDMGTCRDALKKLGGEVQRHRGCFTHGSVSGHECEVRLSFIRPWVEADLCSLKISDDISPAG